MIYIQHSLSLVYVFKRLARIDINVVNLIIIHVLIMLRNVRQIYQYRDMQYSIQLHDIYYLLDIYYNYTIFTTITRHLSQLHDIYYN